MEDSGPLTRLCPRCGVAVPSGYVKCPRCHGELPLPVQDPARRRQGTDGGGTAVAPGANRMTWYLGGAGLAVIVLIAWLALRGGGGATARTSAPDAEDEVGTEPEPGQGEPTQTQVERPTPTVPVAAGNDGAAAVSSLGRALRAERLWSGVAADGDIVVIDSSFCDDAALTAIVDAAVGELRAAKFRSIRCRAPHGAIMFDRSL